MCSSWLYRLRLQVEWLLFIATHLNCVLARVSFKMQRFEQEKDVSYKSSKRRSRSLACLIIVSVLSFVLLVISIVFITLYALEKSKTTSVPRAQSPQQTYCGTKPCFDTARGMKWITYKHTRNVDRFCIVEANACFSLDIRGIIYTGWKFNNHMLSHCEDQFIHSFYNNFFKGNVHECLSCVAVSGLSFRIIFAGFWVLRTDAFYITFWSSKEFPWFALFVLCPQKPPKLINRFSHQANWISWTTAKTTACSAGNKIMCELQAPQPHAASI